MPQQEVKLDVGPFLGVYNSPDTGAKRKNRLYDAKNLFVADPKNGSAYLERHGFLGLATALGSGSIRTGQKIYQHRRLSGLIDRFMFAGGKMYRWDGGAIATDITPAGVTIDASNPVFCASYNDLLIVSDECNKPWYYDPTAASATVIEIDDAGTEWTTKGGPIVYGGVIFFILSQQGVLGLLTETGDALVTESGLHLTTELIGSFQNTIVWGEPLDPATGYDQLDYDNVWQLVATSSEILGLIIGEEGELVYYRNEGIGTLTGPVDESFRGQSTKDSISTTKGTDAPAAGISVDKTHWFVDMDGRVCRKRGEVEELWYPTRATVDDKVGESGNRATVVACARAAFHSAYNLVLFTIWDRQTIYCFDADSGRFVGTWSIGGGIYIDAMGSMVDENNRQTFMILGTRSNSYTGTAQGVIWKQKHEDDTNQWLDTADASLPLVVLPHDVAAETHWLVSDVAETFRIKDVKLSLLGDTSRHAVGLRYQTPAGGQSNVMTAQSTATSGTTSPSKAAYSPGKNAQGDSIRLRVTVTHSDNVRFGLNDVVAVGPVVKARTKAA